MLLAGKGPRDLQARQSDRYPLYVEAANSLTELIAGGTEIWSSATQSDGGSAASTPVTVIDPQAITNVSRFLRLKVTTP